MTNVTENTSCFSFQLLSEVPALGEAGSFLVGWQGLPLEPFPSIAHPFPLHKVRELTRQCPSCPARALGARAWGLIITKPQTFPSSSGFSPLGPESTHTHTHTRSRTLALSLTLSLGNFLQTALIISPDSYRAFNLNSPCLVSPIIN